MQFNDYHYIYPPRPENAVPPRMLNTFKGYIAEAKLNGSCTEIYTNGTEFIVMNRHKEKQYNFKLKNEELKKLYRGSGWMMLVGEYLNKSQNDELDEKWNHKLVIFDIIVFNGKHLVGSTFQERLDLLDALYGEPEETKPHVHQLTENIYKVVPIKGDYYEAFQNLFNYGSAYEGIVLKRANAKLEKGDRKQNNTKSQIKSRKPTKNYKY